MEVSEMPSTYCPACDGVVVRDKPRMGAVITCRECGAELEVINTDPFEVDFPLDYADGWEDDWEEEE
jgi:lysine biosynthesis protein LysW